MWLILPIAPGPDEFLQRLQVDLTGALLQSDLQNPAGGARGVQHDGRLAAQPAHGLFRVDVLAGVHRIHRVILMPVVGRADQDGVDFLQFQQLAVIAEGLGAGRTGQRLFEALGVDVAQGAYLHVGVFLEEALHIGAASAGTDDAQTDAVIGAQNSGIGESRYGGGSCRVASRHHGASSGLKYPELDTLKR